MRLALRFGQCPWFKHCLPERSPSFEKWKEKERETPDEGRQQGLSLACFAIIRSPTCFWALSYCCPPSVSLFIPSPTSACSSRSHKQHLAEPLPIVASQIGPADAHPPWTPFWKPAKSFRTPKGPAVSAPRPLTNSPTYPSHVRRSLRHVLYIVASAPRDWIAVFAKFWSPPSSFLDALPSTYSTSCSDHPNIARAQIRHPRR